MASRIWKAIQSLDGGSPAETPTLAKSAATAARKPAKKAKHDKGRSAKATKSATKAPAKPAKGRKPATKAAQPATARDGSKKATVLGLLQRKAVPLAPRL